MLAMTACADYFCFSSFRSFLRLLKFSAAILEGEGGGVVNLSIYIYQCLLKDYAHVSETCIKRVQALNASSRAALMLKLDRSGTATRYFLSIS
jgi:hypothetical protein